MSSEGSSDRANSRNAFEDNSLSSSTSEFSWTDSSRWDSASLQDNAAEGSSKPVGGQDEAETTSSGHVDWSCAYDTLTLIVRNALRLAEYYGLEVDVPSGLCKEQKPPKGYVTVS